MTDGRGKRDQGNASDRARRQHHETWPLDCVSDESRQLVSVRSWRAPEDVQGAKLATRSVARWGMISNPHEHYLGVVRVTCRNPTAEEQRVALSEVGVDAELLRA